MLYGHQHVTWHSADKVKKTTNPLIGFETDILQPGDSHCFEGNSIPVPECPPSSLPGCSIIDIDYILKVS